MTGWQRTVSAKSLISRKASQLGQYRGFDRRCSGWKRSSQCAATPPPVGRPGYREAVERVAPIIEAMESRHPEREIAQRVIDYAYPIIEAAVERRCAEEGAGQEQAIEADVRDDERRRIAAALRARGNYVPDGFVPQLKFFLLKRHWDQVEWLRAADFVEGMEP